MKLDLGHFVLSHLIWVIGVSAALLIGSSWLKEHDQRLLSAQEAAISDARNKQLEQDKKDILAQAAVQKTRVRTIVQSVKTPEQAVVAIPQLTDLPLNTRVLPQSPGEVAVSAPALVQALGRCRQDQIDLGACQQTVAKDKEESASKDEEIKKLKHPRTFWQNTKSTSQKVGIGILIGIVLALLH